MKINRLFAVNVLLAAVISGLLLYTKPAGKPLPSGEAVKVVSGSDFHEERPGVRLTVAPLIGAAVDRDPIAPDDPAPSQPTPPSGIKNHVQGAAIPSPGSPTRFEHATSASKEGRMETAASASQPSPGTSASSPAAFVTSEVMVPVNSATPGSQLVVNGQRVTVEAVVTDADGRTEDLELAINPVAVDHPTVPAARAPHAPRPRNSGKGGLSGLTYEEELFRTKWGWVAYDQARKAAMGIASGNQ